MIGRVSCRFDDVLAFQELDFSLKSTYAVMISVYKRLECNRPSKHTVYKAATFSTAVAEGSHLLTRPYNLSLLSILLLFPSPIETSLVYELPVGCKAWVELFPTLMRNDPSNTTHIANIK